jgi:hypothetical protein
MEDAPGRPVTGSRAWRSVDFESPADWLTVLDASDVRTISDAANALPRDPHSWVGVEMAEVVLPEVASILSPVRDDLWDGRGFVWLRGLPGDDPEHLRRLFWVIGNNLGEPVMQNARGQVLSEVTDLFAGAERGADTRGYESNDELRFHCDGGDGIGLACVRQAPSGGENGLVSLPAIYNELLAHHPERLAALERGFALYTRKESGGDPSRHGKVNDRRIPVFGWQDGRISCWVNIKLAELAAEMSETPFTEAEQAALTCVEDIAERDDMKLTARSQPGDVVWVNNLSVMHRRARYEDDPARRRLLYRMWNNRRDPQPVVVEHAALRGGIRGPRPTVGASVS